MKNLIMVNVLMFMFLIMNGQDSLKNELKNLLLKKQEYLYQLKVLERKRLEEMCITKRMFKYELEHEKVMSLTKRDTSVNVIKPLKEQIRYVNYELKIIKSQIYSIKNEHLNHVNGSVRVFDDMYSCLNLNKNNNPRYKLFFTFFKDHNRVLLGLDNIIDFRNLSPDNIPLNILYWYIPIEFMLLEELDPIANVPNGNAVISDLESAYEEGTIKFTKIKRIAK